MKTPFRSPALGRLALLVAAGLLLAGCSSHGDKADKPENPFKTATAGPGGTKAPLSDRELRLQADQLYRRARNALDNSDFSTAITRYDSLIARYPFSDYSTQAELEKIYAHYKSFQPDEAATAADRFLRAHPRHPHADYVQYIKGLADFERDDTILDSITPGSAKRDVGNQLRSFEDFALLLQRYPNSRYYGDARRRMLYSRNRIASHQLSVAQFYVTRGAYVAAAKRATDIITEYPGAPATADALRILQQSYTKLGMTQEANDTATLIAMNSDTVTWTDAPRPKLVTRAPPPPPKPATSTAALPTDAPATAPAEVVPVTGPQPATPATSDQLQAAAAPAKPAEKPGLFTRFANLFSSVDSSKPENQHTYVIGGSKAAATTAPDATAPAATGTATAADAAAQPATQGNGFKLSYGGTDDAAATAASGPVAPAGSKPDSSSSQPEKKGFFSWFTGLFSSGSKSQTAPAQPAAAAGTPSGAGSNSDTAK